MQWGNIDVDLKGVEPVATRRVNHPHASSSKQPPGTTPEARENQLIALAADLAERQMRDGTASAQVVTHFLKLGSSTERLEQLKKKHEVDLLQAKAEAMESAKQVEVLYGKALNAMRRYSGQDAPEGEDDEYDD